MRKWIVITAVAFVLGLGANAWATDHSHGHSADSSGKQAMDAHDQHKMDHSDGSHGSEGKNFTHTMMQDGIHAEFQVMSLASMNMKDPAGNTHHIMVKMARSAQGEPVKGLIGKIKVIAPSDAEP